MGAVVACGPGDQGDKLEDEYVRIAEQNASAVVVSQTWAEVHRINSRIRNALKAKGLLGASDTKVQALERLDLTENTLVLYTTDHGEMAVQHGLRGKFTFFEGSARIPLIARLPGHTPAGARSRALVDQGDFVPTLLDVCGIDPAPRSQPLDGASFAPCLAEPAQPGKPFAFGEFALPRRPFYMRRDDRWKYVYYEGLEREGVTPFEELYDLDSDPRERHNLAADPEHHATAAHARRELLAFIAGEAAPA